MLKALDKWFIGYLRSVLSRPWLSPKPRHLIFCICDHYEPFRGGAETEVARQIVRDWVAAYPAMAEPFRDADGRPPRYTFFYPEEEYDAEIMDGLTSFCRKGYGEVEIHLHHRHDTPEGLREKLVRFRDLLHEKHGLLGEEKTIDHRPLTLDRGEENNIEQKTTKTAKEKNYISAGGGEQNPPSCSSRASVQTPEFSESNVYGLRSVVSSSVRYGFIHANWSLCNSRPDGDWCGVNEELGILAETGCYADFTFPSAPSPTQPHMVNAIYYATDTPGRPRAADRGAQVQTIDHRPQTIDHRPQTIDPGNTPSACRSMVYGLKSKVSSLLLITGPLALNWRCRKWGIIPRLENAEISGTSLPTADRIRLWARQNIHVRGRPDWIFVKLHTHGCMPANARVLLGEAMRKAHEILQREFNDGQRWQLHYVTAREMANLVKAAEANLPGPPGQYRDYQVSPPTF